MNRTHAHIHFDLMKMKHTLLCSVQKFVEYVLSPGNSYLEKNTPFCVRCIIGNYWTSEVQLTWKILPYPGTRRAGGDSPKPRRGLCS